MKEGVLRQIAKETGVSLSSPSRTTNPRSS
jgi:hypothetical protein